MTDSQTELEVLAAYVRLCGDEDRDCREIRVKISEGIDQRDLLDAGFAIDGNSATTSVTDYETNDGTYVPLSEALRDRQQELISWFQERGFYLRFQ